MQINSNFPVQSGFGRFPPSKALVAVDSSSVKEKAQFSIPPSSASSFEQAYQTENGRFHRMDGFDLNSKDAIASYQATQSLAADNPRNYLIGVDVYA